MILAYSWRSMVSSMGKEHGQNRGPTRHMGSSSSMRKNKEVLSRNGGGKFGKGICFIFVLIGSKCRS